MASRVQSWRGLAGSGLARPGKASQDKVSPLSRKSAAVD
jgi:hypothetical protein